MNYSSASHEESLPLSIQIPQNTNSNYTENQIPSQLEWVRILNEISRTMNELNEDINENNLINNNESSDD